MSINDYVISALKSVINNDDSFVFDDKINYTAVFEFSCNHQVENIVAYALLPYKDSINSDDWSKFEKCLMVAAMQDTRQTAELEILLAEFEKYNIDYMLLKGYLIKHLYPSTDMRIMGDIDILTKPEQTDLVKKVMSDLNYVITYENIREFNCVKNRFIHMEIHLDMISAQYKKYHDYYNDIWDKATNTKGRSYKISDEDYFIYHIVHLVKHYKGTGTGIRSFLDVWVFLKNKSELNWQYVYTELKKINLDIFAEKVVELAKLWFGDGEKTELLLQMENYVFKSGVYGSEEHSDAYSAVKSIKNGKVNTYINMLFPSMHVMSSIYPKLRRCKYLLWFYYLKRIIDKVFKKGISIDNVLSETKISDDAKKISEHLKEIGLWEDI